MALKPCKSCKKEVDHTAKTCPHCGVKDPGVTGGQMFIGFVVLAAIVAGIAASCTDNDKTTASQKVSDADCLKDLECIGNKGTFTAGLKCAKEIEKQAKNSVKWTDGALEAKFSHFRWKDKDAGIVTHLGDKVQFQNGFGAWVNMVYSCDLDMTKSPGELVGIHVAEGRL